MSDLKKKVEISADLWRDIGQHCDGPMLQRELRRLGLSTSRFDNDEQLRQRLQDHLLKRSDEVHVSKSTCETTESKLRLEFKIDNLMIMKLQGDRELRVISKPAKFGGYDWTMLIKNSFKDEDEEKRCLGLFVYCAPGKLKNGEVASFKYGCSELHSTYMTIAHDDFSGGWGTRSFADFEDAILHHSLTFFADISLFSGFTVRENDVSSISSLQLFKLHEIVAPNDGDLTIMLKDNTNISAHKLVLTSHSPVFTAMFSHNLAESLDNSIEIDDFEPQEVKIFIEILYSGFVPKDVDFSSLFLLADKYKIDILAKHCLKQLVRSRTVENCVELMLNMERFNYLDDDDKQSLASFMFEHYDEIQDQEGFAKLNRDSLLLILHCRGKKRKFNAD